VTVIEPDRRDLDIRDREQEIPDDEKKQILDQIEKSISESVVPVALQAKPKKKGLLFPCIVNLAALIVLVAAVFTAFRVFEVRREKLDLETRTVASAEGKILDEFKREAEEKLKEKDTAILRVLKQLGSLERERSQLSRIMELRIQEKEREMRRELEAELQRRKEDLRQNGVAAAEIERQLLALETEKKRQIFGELKAFQDEIDSLTRRKEQELLREKEMARRSLELATLEREELMFTTQKQEIELLDRIRPEETGIAISLAAQDRFTERETLSVQERLVVDQIVSSYIEIAAKLAGKRYEQASAELTELEAIFLDQRVSGLPAIERRKAADLKIITAFRSLIAEATVVGRREEPSGSDTAVIEDLRLELQEKEREIERLGVIASAEPVQAVDPQTVAAQARRSAYQDVLRTIARFEAVKTEEELNVLRRELRSEAVEDSLYNTFVAALQGLTVESVLSAEKESLSYRILGTVTLVGTDSITILPIVNLPVRVGERIEVRRILDSGESSRVARGTLTDVQGEKLVARIDRMEVQGGVSVTDKVYLIVD